MRIFVLLLTACLARAMMEDGAGPSPPQSLSEEEWAAAHRDAQTRPLNSVYTPWPFNSAYVGRGYEIGSNFMFRQIPPVVGMQVGVWAWAAHAQQVDDNFFQLEYPTFGIVEVQPIVVRDDFDTLPFYPIDMVRVNPPGSAQTYELTRPYYLPCILFMGTNPSLIMDNTDVAAAQTWDAPHIIERIVTLSDDERQTLADYTAIRPVHGSRFETLVQHFNRLPDDIMNTELTTQALQIVNNLVENELVSHYPAGLREAYRALLQRHNIDVDHFEYPTVFDLRLNRIQNHLMRNSNYIAITGRMDDLRVVYSLDENANYMTLRRASRTMYRLQFHMSLNPHATWQAINLMFTGESWWGVFHRYLDLHPPRQYMIANDAHISPVDTESDTGEAGPAERPPAPRRSKDEEDSSSSSSGVEVVSDSSDSDTVHRPNVNKPNPVPPSRKRGREDGADTARRGKRGKVASKTPRGECRGRRN